MTTLNPDAVRKRMSDSGLNISGLAAASCVSKRTLSRFFNGQTKPNAATSERIAKALGCSVDDLAAPPAASEKKAPFSVFARLTIPRATLLDAELAARRYGVAMHQIFGAAPTLFSLIAEMSLEARKKRVEKLRAAVDDALDPWLESTDDGFRALCDVEETCTNETVSIDRRDIEGRRVNYRSDHEPDPFTRFLKAVAHNVGLELDPGADHWPDLGVVAYSEEIDRICGNDLVARHALLAAHVKISDIPADVLSEDGTERRIAWLRDRVPPTRRAEIEEFFSSLNVDL